MVRVVNLLFTILSLLMPKRTPLKMLLTTSTYKNKEKTTKQIFKKDDKSRSLMYEHTDT